VKVKPIADFEKKAKRLMKKYNSLAGELRELRKDLCQNPTKGTPIGRSCYKIRLAIESKGKGKSGGARVITHYYIHGNTVYLLSIYDKAEQENLSAEELAELLRGINVFD
jgi:mRNA-degrading endonuclease RelE of RelBE toxin-antitoxin system